MAENEENYRELLDKHRVEMVQCLDLDRQYIFCHLRSKFVLDDEDCQIILNAGPSRQQKSQKFIDVLCTKGPDSFQHFVDALEIEHPHLYEVFTGKKPCGKRFNFNQSQVIPWAVLTDKQLLDFDREYLVKELTKSSDTNQTMVYMYSKIIKEKNVLEQRYADVSRELEERELTIKELQTEVEKNKNHSPSAHAHDNDHFEQLQAYIYHCQEMMRDNIEKSNIIIMLQSRLLAMTEEIENSEKRDQLLRRKNENLMQQVRDLTINYDQQRTKSKRLSLQLDQNNDVIKEVSTTKKDIYQLKFHLNHVTEERDEAIQQLDEFKTVMAALNARHDVLQQELSVEEKRKDQVSEGCQRLNEKIHKLETELNEEKNKTESLRRKDERQSEQLETYKEQHDFYLSEREHAIRDRDLVTKDRDDLMRFNQELQKSRDEAVRKQIDITSQVETKFTQMSKELDQCREELEEQRMKPILQEIVQVRPSLHDETETLVNNEKSEDDEEGNGEEVEVSELQRKWRERTKTEVLQSAYKKLASKNSNRKKVTSYVPSLNYSEMAYVYDSLKGIPSFDSISIVAQSPDCKNEKSEKSESGGNLQQLDIRSTSIYNNENLDTQSYDVSHKKLTRLPRRDARSMSFLPTNHSDDSNLKDAVTCSEKSRNASL